MVNENKRKMMHCIDKIMMHNVKEKRRKKFVIYPNGLGGEWVREYIKTEYGISIEYVIDNKQYNGENILSLEQARERENKDTYFLICSWNPDIYHEIRKVIYEFFPAKQIIDIFPQNNKTLTTIEEILDVLDYIQGNYVNDWEK